MTDGVVGDTGGFDDLGEEDSLRDLLGDRPLEQPIELLVQLADDGEIDPWDLDLIGVTDAFLERIDDADLIVTARTLFYASVLLRMKSDEIVGLRDEPVEEVPAPHEEPDGDPVAVLEAEMDRRLTRKRARGTPTTLAELIRELRTAERDRFWKRSRTYDTSGNGRLGGPQTLDYREIDGMRAPGEAVHEVSDTPHHENLESVLEPLLDHLIERFETTPSVAFESVVHVGPSPARVFAALVFLEHRGAIRLHQRALYEPLSAEVGPKGTAAGYRARSGDEGEDADPEA